MISRPVALVLDAHALAAMAGQRPAMGPWLVAVHRTDSTLHASAATLAEITDGSARDAKVHWAMKAVRLEPVTTAVGYLAGALRARAAQRRRKARDLSMDALVAATAVSLAVPTVVLTGDPGDLRLLLEDTDVSVVALT